MLERSETWIGIPAAVSVCGIWPVDLVNVHIPVIGSGP
jgi:hypothetical protein